MGDPSGPSGRGRPHPHSNPPLGPQTRQWPPLRATTHNDLFGKTVLVQRAEGDLDLKNFAVAIDFNDDHVARAVPTCHSPKFIKVANRHAVDRNDEVSGLDAGLIGGAATRDTLNIGASTT